MLDPSLADALVAFVGAIVGSLISGIFILRQTTNLPNGEARRRETERELEIKSTAAALLWEIDDIYRLSIRDVCRFFKDKNPTEISFDTKSLTFRRFTVYQATASKVGLFDPDLVRNIVGWYGTLSAYFDTIYDYGRTIEQIQGGQRLYEGKALELQRQIRASCEAFVAPTKGVCESLAARSGTAYQFEAP